MPAKKTTKPTRKVASKPRSKSKSSKVSKSKMPYTPFFLTAVIILLVLLGYSTYLNMGTGKEKMDSDTMMVIEDKKIMPEVTYTDAMPVSNKVNPAMQEEGKYSWKDFNLFYPNSWKIAQETLNKPKVDLYLKLQRVDGSSFDIFKGSEDYGRCVFPDENDYNTFMGAGNFYQSYEELNKGDVKWRLAENTNGSNKWTHALCEFDTSTGLFFAKNKLGIENINILTPDAKNEFIGILNKAELLN